MKKSANQHRKTIKNQARELLPPRFRRILPAEADVRRFVDLAAPGSDLYHYVLAELRRRSVGRSALLGFYTILVALSVPLLASVLSFWMHPALSVEESVAALLSALDLVMWLGGLLLLVGVAIAIWASNEGRHAAWHEAYIDGVRRAEEARRHSVHPKRHWWRKRPVRRRRGVAG